MIIDDWNASLLREIWQKVFLFKKQRQNEGSSFSLNYWLSSSKLFKELSGYWRRLCIFIYLSCFPGVPWRESIKDDSLFHQSVYVTAYFHKDRHAGVDLYSLSGRRDISQCTGFIYTDRWNTELIGVEEFLFFKMRRTGGYTDVSHSKVTLNLFPSTHLNAEMVIHICNFSDVEAETRESLWLEGHPV